MKMIQKKLIFRVVTTMSRIVTRRKCDNCGYEKDVYISFGHPDHDINYDWKCEKCGYINHRVAKALPMSDLGWVKLSDLENMNKE